VQGNALASCHNKLQKIAGLTYAIYTTAVKYASLQGDLLILHGDSILKSTQTIVLALITAIGIGAMTSSYAIGMGMESGGGCAMAGNKMGNPAQIDGHLAKIKKDLNIGSDQDEAWSMFVKAIKLQKTEMMSAMQKMQHTSKVQPAQAAPDRLGEHIQFMKQRVAGMETAATAMKQLYGVLTLQQKEILDARFGQDMPM
jgi:hypothetical protein